MVLQRGAPLAIWGKAAPGEKLEVKFNNKVYYSWAKRDSSWKLLLPKLNASADPKLLTITCGDTSVQFSDILVGDIWVCTGQSNMEWPMFREQHWKEEISNTDQPLIRLLNPPPVGRNVFGVAYTDSLIVRLNAEKFYAWNSWETCNNQSVRTMSAVAYFFAKKVSAETGVPIGIINLSIGGAPLEAFISKEALLGHPVFSKKLNGNWLKNDSLPVWVRERGAQNIGGALNVPSDNYGPNHAYKPGFAFEAGVERIRDFPVKGILVYQGESNAEELARVEEYKELFKLFIKDYRHAWNNKSLPVYWVQLSSIERKFWHLFRNEQLQLWKETKNTGMAVCSDIGLKTDVHPPDKKTVGERLARLALAKQYNKKLVVSGPLPVRATYSNGRLTIFFHYTSKGLMSANGETIKGFSTDGNTETVAVAEGSTIIITVPQKPPFIYYGWKPFSNGNLVNSEKLPASTFKLKVR